MNFDEKVESAKAEMKALLLELAVAKKETRNFLRRCEEEGIKRVSIGTATNKIKSAKAWGANTQSSCFADEKEKGGHFPAIWRVCDGGCGNEGQHSNNNARLIDGVYELKNGKWFPVEP